MDAFWLTLAATGTALATGLGTLPVLWLGRRVASWTPALWAIAGAIMAAAAVFGLFIPAVRESGAAIAGLSAVGGAFVFGGARRRLSSRRDLHLGVMEGPGARRGILVAATMFVHSFPEGLAIGAAWATTGPEGAFVVAAIAVQNVPEGMVTALPLREAGISGVRTFWAAVATSAPQIPGALLAFAAVETVTSLLGISFALAAGAMLALVALEVVPAVAAGPPVA